MSIQAYALHRIHRTGKDKALEVIPANNVFTATDEEYSKLEKLNAVRKATKEEIVIAKSQEDYLNGTSTIETSTKEDEPDAKNAPPSGAKGDPKNAPKGASKPAGDGGSDDDI